jgi:hypothetical protein
VAQINYAESNAKIDLLLAIIGETYWRAFHQCLVYQIQLFETDEKVFRIANDSFRQKENIPPAFSPRVETVDDFDADVIVNIGGGVVGRQFEIQNTLLAMDRALMANQSTGALLQLGVIDPAEVRFFNVAAFMEDLLPRLGKKAIDKYFVKARAPAAAPGASPEASPQGQAMAGQMAPQVGGTQENILPFNPGGGQMETRRSMQGG